MIRLKSIFLLILFSGSVFANNLEFHLCDGLVTDVALVGNSHCVCDDHESHQSGGHSCHKQEEVKKPEHSCCSKKSEQKSAKENSLLAQKDKSCCETVIISAEISDIEFLPVSFITPVVVPVGQISVLPAELKERALNTVDLYSPPKRTRDIPVLVQSFLI